MLTEIERRIQDARDALERLLDEKEQMASVLNQHHDPFVHHLPVEITSHIFTHYQQALVPPISYPFISHHAQNQKAYLKAAVALSHTCRNWRRIAHSTPELWTFLFVAVTPSNCALSATIVPEWLERSKGLPLFIGLHMRMQDPQSQFFAHFARKVVESAIQHARRWEVLDLFVPQSPISWLSDSLSTTPLAQLNHLRLETYDHQHGNADSLRLQASPRHLTSFLIGFGTFHIDFGRLTSVTAASVTLDECLRLLSEAQQLSSCEISQVTRSMSGSQAHVQNSSLHTLKLSDATDGFWNHFTFPALRILRVDYPFNDSQCWTQLQDLLRRSGCKIIELQMQDDRDDQLALVDILRLTPDLERLTIEFPAQLFSRMVTAANETVHAAPFLSKLVTLTCTTVDLEFDFSWLVTFLTTMTMRQPRSLQSFEFQYQDYDREFSPVIPRDLLNHLRDAGRDLECRLLDVNGNDLMGQMFQAHGIQY